MSDLDHAFLTKSSRNQVQWHDLPLYNWSQYNQCDTFHKADQIGIPDFVTKGANAESLWILKEFSSIN